MGKIADAIAWSGSGATLSLFVVSKRGALLDPAALPLALVPLRTKTYALDDVDNVLSGRHLVEYDLDYSEVPSNLDMILTNSLQAVRRSGADVAWFGFEGSFDFGAFLTAQTANQTYAVMDAEGIALASDASLSSTTWQERIVRAGERARRDSASRSGV